MGRASAEQFAQLLTEGVQCIRLQEAKSIQIVQDELGYALGKAGGSSIEYWRKGNIPAKYHDTALLAREIVRRGRLARPWLEDFLHSAGYPNPAVLCDEVFPPSLGAYQMGGPELYDRVPPLPAQRRTHDRFSPSVEALPPFIVGPPVTHPRLFFGRCYEVKRIFDLWRHHPLQNVAVIGAKRSGKTSLLHYLKSITRTPSTLLRSNQRNHWLSQPEHYRWVFVDFQDARMHNRDRLLRYILSGLHLPAPTPCDLYDFIDIVSEQLTAPAVILMDAIGAALEAPELDQHFWWSLRALSSHHAGGNLGFLLAAHEAPATLAQAQGKPSPFFNIFGHTFTLGPLTIPEAYELVASSPIAFPASDVEWIVEHSGQWPCLLQIMCHLRLAALDTSTPAPVWKEEALRHVTPFEHLLKHG